LLPAASRKTRLLKLHRGGIFSLEAISVNIAHSMMPNKITRCLTIDPEIKGSKILSSGGLQL
jgi:hypothetical protein